MSTFTITIPAEIRFEIETEDEGIALVMAIFVIERLSNELIPLFLSHGAKNGAVHINPDLNFDVKRTE